MPENEANLKRMQRTRTPVPTYRDIVGWQTSNILIEFRSPLLTRLSSVDLDLFYKAKQDLDMLLKRQKPNHLPYKGSRAGKLYGKTVSVTLVIVDEALMYPNGAPNSPDFPLLPAT